MIEVDIRVPVGRPLPQLADFIQRCEAAGLHGVGVHDHHHSGRDVYVALALAAARTSHLTLYPATSNAVTRHPLVLAALVNSLAEIAPGRVLLTLAPGFLSVERAGEPQAARALLGEVVTQVRGLLSGAPTRLGEQVTTLAHPVTPRPEVYILAGGPRLLELAGEVADGVLIFAGLHPDAIAAARAHVRAGAARAGRDPRALGEIFVVTNAFEPLEQAREWPRRWFRPGLPFLEYPSRSNLRWLRAAGLEVPDTHDPRSIGPDLAARIADAFGLFGPPERCAERLLQAREESGVEHVLLFPAHTAETSYDLPEADVEVFASVLGPRLAAPG
ncbi:MAG: LLM class flavin-dependent oxidoreductase [Candidatus Dormiibacterota bacterium]